MKESLCGQSRKSSFCFAACGKKFTKVRVARTARLFFPVQLQANGIMVLWPPSQSTVPNYLQCYRLDFFVWFIGDCVIDFLVIFSCTQPRQVHHRTRKSEKKSLFSFLFCLFDFFPHLLKLQKLSTTSFVAYGKLHLKQTLFCQVKTRAKKSRMNYALLDGRRACQRLSRQWQRFLVTVHLRISRETLTLIVGIERKTREEEEKVRKSKCCSGGRGL